MRRLNIQVIDMTDFGNDVEPGANDPTVYTTELQTLHNMGVFIVTPVGNTPGGMVGVDQTHSDDVVLGRSSAKVFAA